MKVLVTGIEGYLGSLLAPVLTARGHTVVGLDTAYYRNGHLYNAPGNLPAVIVKDLRDVTADDLRGFDAIVHMAELSNDPAGDLNPRITYEINHGGTVRLARCAQKAGIERFVYMSSCSVYGIADTDEPLTEESAVNPKTAYAECKVLCERDLTLMAGDDFSPVFFRNSTAFGASPRQRFDLVVNNLCGLAWTTGKIAMTSDGSPWRPLVHGLDIAQGIALALEAPRETVHAEVFNVGANHQNYRVREIAEMVGEVFTGCEVTFGPSNGDNRSYKVNFDKIHRHLPEFECQWDVKRGIQQMYALFKRIDMDEATFRYRAFTRLKQLQFLLKNGQIDENFYWQPCDAVFPPEPMVSVTA